jgi:hypothetical protein
LVSLTAPLLAVMRPLNRQLAYSDATIVRISVIVNTPIAPC